MHRFLAACSLMFLLPFSVRASGPAFISEIAWAGSSASIADEWLELCGPPGTDLSGWSIEGASASPIALPSGSVIPASGAYLIANYGDADAKSTLAVAPNLVTTSVAVSNAKLFVVLRDAGGASADVAGAPDEAPFAGTSGEAKASMERLDASLDGGIAEAWTSAATAVGFDAGAIELGTPGTCGAPPAPEAPSEPEETPAPSATSTEETAAPTAPPPPEAPMDDAAPVEPMSALRISEIYPSPLSGEKEWLEIVNPSNTGEFLDGWTIEDGAGTKTPLAGLLLPWTYRIVEAPKGSLNNDGDTVILRDRFGRAVDDAGYGKIAKGLSFMRVDLQDAFVVTKTPTPGAANVFTSTEEMPLLSSSVIPSEVEEPLAVHVAQAIPPLAALGRNDENESTAKIVPNNEKKKPAPKPVVKTAAAKPKAPVTSKYKGEAYAATVVVPSGVYAKTRMYVLRDGAIEELRLSKGVEGLWNVGDRISFVAQTKTEGAVTFLLTNPNSVRKTGSASTTFATVDAWPEEAGGYRFVAEVVSIRGSALEVTLGGIEGDVLAPTGSSSALKPGDQVEIEGFVSPGARPSVVLPHDQAIKLFKAHAADPSASAARTSKLPVPLAVGLTAVAGGVGLAAYLRMQRLKRLALTQAPLEEGAWD